MTLIATESGCKVGWEIYDNEAEAIEASKRARALAIRKAEQGYDFGYCVPGEIQPAAKHTDRHDGTVYHDVWVVTIP